MNRTKRDAMAVMVKDAILALENWGHEEDGIPQLYRDGRQGDPWAAYLRLCYALCQLSAEKRCHTCADRQCGDNTTPEGIP